MDFQKIEKFFSKNFKKFEIFSKNFKKFEIFSKNLKKLKSFRKKSAIFPHSYSGPPRWPDEVPAPSLRMERGFVDEDTTDESFRGLKRRECACSAACQGSGHTLSGAESACAAPCSAAKSLRRGGADAEAGPATAPQQGQGEQHATQTDKIG